SAGVVASVADGNTVSRDIELGQARACEIAALCSRRRRDQVEDVAGSKGQVAYFVFRQDSADRRRCRRDQRVGCDADFDRLSLSSHLKREVEPHLLRDTQGDVVITLRLKTWKLRSHFIRSGLQ